MKYCAKCDTDKLPEDFGKSAKRYDKLQPYCKVCMKAYQRARYERHKDSYKASAKARRAAVMEYISRVKAAPCTDCGDSYPHYVMDLDHVRGEKVERVSRLANNGNLEAVKQEIEKCEVVCSNCHRQRTWERAQAS